MPSRDSHQSGADLFYDGRSLPFGEDAFDVVILSFVLHHAAENTLVLLRQVRTIASSWLLVGEDVAALDGGSTNASGRTTSCRGAASRHRADPHLAGTGDSGCRPRRRL